MDPTFFPMIWFETTTRIDGTTGMGIMVVLVANLNIIMYTLGGITVLIGCIFSVWAVYIRRRQNRLKTV